MQRSSCFWFWATLALQILTIGPKTTSLPTSRILALPQREVKEPRQGAGVLEPQPCRLPSCLWFPDTQAIVNASSSPAPWSSAHPDVDSSKKPKTTRLKLTNNVQVPFREQLSTPKRESQHSGPTASRGDPPRAHLRIRRSRPVRHLSVADRGRPRPASHPGGPTQGSQGAKEMGYWVRKWANV